MMGLSLNYVYNKDKNKFTFLLTNNEYNRGKV